MLKIRVIPCLDVHDGQVTRGVQFGKAEAGELRNVGDPVELALQYNEQGADLLEGYKAMRDDILQAAFDLYEGETSQVLESNEGDFLAVHLAKVNERTYRPLDEVRSSLNERWVADKKRANNRTFVRQALEQERTLEEIASTYGKSVEDRGNITRDSRAVGRFAPYTIANIFAAPLNEIIAVDVDGGAAILQVTEFKWPEIDVESSQYKAFKADQERDSQNEALQAYLMKQQDMLQPMINERLLGQLYGPQNQEF